MTLEGSSFLIDKSGEKAEPFWNECGFHDDCYRSYHPSTSYYDIIKTGEKEQLVRKHGRFPGDNYVFPKEYKFRDTLDMLFDTIIPINGSSFYVMTDSRFTFNNAQEFHERLHYDQDSSYRSAMFFRPQIEKVKEFECKDSRCSNKDFFIGVKEKGLWGYYKLRRNCSCYSCLCATRHIDPKYISIGSLANGHALVEYAIGKYGYIDSDGNEYFVR